MADNRVQEAIDVVARRIIADEARATAGEFHVMHEIPSAEWETVSAAITSAADGMDPGTDAYEAAVEYLASRDGAS